MVIRCTFTNPTSHNYACFVINDETVKPKVKTNVKLTGIDLGIKDLVITSNGQKYANNKFLKKKLLQLKKAQKVLSRRSKKKHTLQVVHETENGQFTIEEKTIFSNRREKARLKVAKLHRDVVNCRNDYLHKVSKHLVDNHEGLAFESLNIRGMVKIRTKNT